MIANLAMMMIFQCGEAGRGLRDSSDPVGQYVLEDGTSLSRRPSAKHQDIGGAVGFTGVLLVVVVACDGYL